MTAFDTYEEKRTGKAMQTLFAKLMGRTAGLVALMILLLGARDVAGQSLSGRIVDESGMPVPGVNVLIEGTSKGAASDTDGRYRIENLDAGLVVIRFSAIGFHVESRTVRLSSDMSLTLDMEMRWKTLLSDEVVVTASRREQPALSVPVSVSVLSTDDLTRRNTVVLDEALRTVSGVSILGNQINVRGSSGFAYNTGSRVLLMLDGMPLLTPDSDGVPLEALPTSEIKQIEVLKGPGSALYGGGALGGVVNVITRDFPDVASTSEIRTFAGVWDPVRHEVWRDGWKHGEEYRPFWGVSASYATRTSPKLAWWTSLTFRRDAGYMALSGRDVFHGFGKLAWQPSPSLRVESLLGIMARQRDNFIFWESARNPLSPGSVNLGDTPEAEASPNGATDDFVRQISFLPVIRHVVSTTFFHEFRLRVFGTLLQPIDDDTGERKSVQEGTLGARYGGEWQGTWIPRAERRITAGISRDALTTKSSFFVTTDGDAIGGQPEQAAFLHLEEAILDDWQLVAGLRYDHYRIDTSESEARLSPKISLAWTGLLNNTFRFALGDGFRVPSFAERFTDNRDYLPIIRNLGLRPEISRSVEVGWRGVIPERVHGAFSWDITVFHNGYQRFIEPRLVPEKQAFQFINLDSATIRGSEVMIEWANRSQTWTTSLGHTWLMTEENDSGDKLPFRPDHQIVLSLETSVLPLIRLGADYRFLTEPDRVETDFARFVTDADQMVDTKVLDLRVSIERGAFGFRFLVQNALEYHYVDRPAILGEPRRFTLQATWKR